MVMTESELREDVKRQIRRHDPDADELRALADRLHELANKYEEMEATL